MGQDNREWSWVGEDGTEHSVAEDELSFALSSEELPAYTLVCRKGWGEWLPAMQVAELLWALPAGRSDNPKKPSIGRKPPAPLNRYAELKRRAEDIASGAIDPTSESSLGLPAIMAAPRAPTASKPELHTEFPRQRNRMFSLADGDEPTLQLDVDALDQAFEKLQAGVDLGDLQDDPVGNLPPPAAQPRVPPSDSADDPGMDESTAAIDTSALKEPPPAPAARSDSKVPRSVIPRPESSSRFTSAPPSPRAPLPTPPPTSAPRAPLPTPPPTSAPRVPLPTPRPTSAARAPLPTPPSASAPRAPQPTAPGSSPRAAPPLPAVGSVPRAPLPTPAPGSALAAQTPAPAPRAALPTPAPVFDSAPSAAPSKTPWQPGSPLPPATTATPLGLTAGAQSSPPWPQNSALSTPLPQAARRRWPWVAAVLVAAGAAGVWWMNTREESPPAVAPVALPTLPAPQPDPPKMTCTVKAKATALAGWAHMHVRPVLSRAPGTNKVAVGYAQTSKLAVGLVLDTLTLAAEKPYSFSQNSPLLSVVPVTSAMGQQLAFLESRAASTLQSAIFVPAKAPFAVGLSSGAVAVRLSGEADRIVWRPPWETISVPATARLDDDTHAIVLRAGGERGSMLMGKLTEQGRAIGELRELAPGTDRLGQPTVTTSQDHIAISFDAGLRGEPQRSVYLGIGKLPELPARAEPVLSFDDEISAVGAVALSQGNAFVQYTRGELTKQRVLGQVLDENSKPVGAPIDLTPPGEDAYNGELFYDGTHILVTFLVRDGNNHEFWATSLSCAMTP